ncbi:CvpA family protein [Planctomicrobium sp. SH661]|uniref:CvpA family protein n=1 Tax=Planctomicrobium sp. SH661 TaxID=3448124 RepID=UPI003F5B9443
MMIMWYDVLVLGILAFFALRGAMRGFIFQIASLAGIILSFVFADAVSNAAGPYVHLDPPMNHWVLMVASYLGFTFLCFLAARMLHEVIEKCKLKEFDRHLGVAFGLIKGVLLVLIMTFFIVTVSESARASLKNSYTGRYCAIIMDRLEPILPHKLHVALEDYIHLLDSPDLPLIHEHDPFEGSSGSNSSLGQSTTLPQPTNSGSSSTGTSSPASALWGQLQQLFDSQSQQIVSSALQNSDPQTRIQLEQKLNSLINSIPPQERANLQQQIVQVGAGQLQQYVDWRLSQLGTPVSPAPSNSSAPSPIPSSNPHLTVIREIAAVYSPLPNVQQNIEQDIQRRIAGIPDSVSKAALHDWKSDLLGHKPDPDPKTGAQVLVEIRIINQMQIQGLRIEQLGADAQQRLRAAQAHSNPSGSSL